MALVLVVGVVGAARAEDDAPAGGSEGAPARRKEKDVPGKYTVTEEAWFDVEVKDLDGPGQVRGGGAGRGRGGAGERGRGGGRAGQLRGMTGWKPGGGGTGRDGPGEREGRGRKGARRGRGWGGEEELS